MNRPNNLSLVTIAVLVGAAVAVYDLLSGWLLSAGWVAYVITLGLFGGAWLLLAFAVFSAFREGRAANARQAARRLVQSSAFAICFCVLLFANCGSAIDSGPNSNIGAMSDAHTYWPLAAAFEIPVLVALLMPGLFSLIRRPTAVIVASLVAAAIAVLSAPFAFVFGVSNCDVGTIGGCAAGLGGLTNLFTAATLGLFVPYAVALARARPSDA